jgi:hypothetical protein
MNMPIRVVQAYQQAAIRKNKRQEEDKDLDQWRAKSKAWINEEFKKQGA